MDESKEIENPVDGIPPENNKETKDPHRFKVKSFTMVLLLQLV